MTPTIADHPRRSRRDLRGAAAAAQGATRGAASISTPPNASRAHIEAGGITRFLYGGNAFLYHITLDEFDVLLGWLAVVPGDALGDPQPRPVVRPRDGSGAAAAAASRSRAR